MSILHPYKVNSYRRLCDICGRPRQIEDIRFLDGVAICTIHPQFRTAQQLNRINARVRPTRVLPVPHPKPLAPIDTWTAEESQIFKFICATAPYDTVDVSANAGAITGVRSYQAIGWALVYLTGLLIENKRPGPWLTQARAKAISLGDLLLQCQRTTDTQATTPLGGLSPFVLDGLNTASTSQQFSDDVGLACAAFCRLYQVTRDAKYLSAAQSAAGFIVFLQAVDLRGGSVSAFYGPPAASWALSIGLDVTFYPSGLLCLWGLSLLQGIVGDGVYGSLTTEARPGAGAGFFKTPPARLLSTSIAQMRAFWATGYGGVVGFSGATPYNSFLASQFVSTVHSWQAGVITSARWAAGIFALAEVDGLSSQVTGLWDYLRTIAGTGYDATLAPPQTFVAGAPTVAALYDWASAGLLAKITAGRARAALKTIKDTLAIPRQRYTERTPRSGETLYLGPLGLSTFALAPVTSTSGTKQRIQSVVRAAQVGMLYRQAPQGFTGRGH